MMGFDTKFWFNIYSWSDKKGENSWVLDEVWIWNKQRNKRKWSRKMMGFYKKLGFGMRMYD